MRVDTHGHSSLRIGYPSLLLGLGLGVGLGLGLDITGRVTRLLQVCAHSMTATLATLADSARTLTLTLVGVGVGVRARHGRVTCALIWSTGGSYSSATRPRTLEGGGRAYTIGDPYGDLVARLLQVCAHVRLA